MTNGRPGAVFTHTNSITESINPTRGPRLVPLYYSRNVFPICGSVSRYLAPRLILTSTSLAVLINEAISRVVDDQTLYNELVDVTFDPWEWLPVIRISRLSSRTFNDPNDHSSFSRNCGLYTLAHWLTFLLVNSYPITTSTVGEKLHGPPWYAICLGGSSFRHHSYWIEFKMKMIDCQCPLCKRHLPPNWLDHKLLISFLFFLFLLQF